MIKTDKLKSLALTLSVALMSTSAMARPMTAEDLATLARVGAPAISPDERWMAFSVTETDAESYERTSVLYLQDLTSKNPPLRIADKAKAGEHSPSFSADGTALYFLSDASGSEQLWRMPVNADGVAGDAVQASDLASDVVGYKLSPKGSHVAVWGDFAKECETFGCTLENDNDGDRAMPGPGTGREYDELFVRHWSSWETPGKYSRIFAFDLQDGLLQGDGLALDQGVTGDSPTKPFGGGEEISWAGDDEGVFFTMRIADRTEPKSTNLDIYGTSVPGQKLLNFTEKNKATDTMPTISPDGEWLAWAAMKRPGYESDKLTLWVREKGSEEERRALTADWDRSVGSIAWAPDGQSLYVTAQDTLDHPVFQVDFASGKITRLTGDGNAANVVPLRDGSLIYTLNTIQAPNEIYRRDADGKVMQLTNINGAALAEIDKVTIQRFDFKGAEGDQVWGLITKPAKAAGPLPLAFLVHGGPQGSFSNSWSFRWNPKVMAAQGYAVVSVDFHGSAGYGQAFKDSINQDWGGKPLEDLRLGHAAALKIDRQIDGSRSCALGASYGGYMMNWIAGNWPQEFDCLINHAGLFDLRSFAFSTEELWFDQWDHGGPWWERAYPEKWNPIQHIDKWRTPTLFIHGEKDFRIPYTQSLMPFTYAQERNIPSKLLIFPDENHWILKGKNSVQWHRTVFDWMNQWTAADQIESQD